MPRKLIIDADPGIGDALAITLAALDPNIDLIGVTASSGCVSGMVATQNIFTVMESVDPDKHPRLGASTASRPIFRQGGVEPPGFLDPLRLNGNYGLGTAEIAIAQLHNQRESAKLLIDLVKNNPHEVTLLTLGPLSNVAIACELAPDFLESLQRLVCLGGSVGVGGDVTAAAEFNIFADPMSAQTVLQSAATRTLVPLDVSNKTVLTFDQFDRLKQNRKYALRWFFDELIPFALRVHHEDLGLEGLPLREVTALASIAEPRHFTSQTMSLAIELQGALTRGATVFDQRGIERWQKNIDVVDSVDTHGVLDYLGQIVRNA
ncbi:MAG: nucleoside hydrolase [Planctomycetales bacterium]|jgi:inosine-uridine nucleoside N-ribohydrolase